MTRNTLTKRAFSLLELTIVLVIMSIALTAVCPNYVKGMLLKAGEKTALDMYTIEEASRAYYIDKKIWPSSISDLKTGNYLPSNWNAKNPFNNAYSIHSTPVLLTVSTDVQAGVQKTVAARLPASVISGTTVSSSIGSPAGVGGVPTGAVMPWPSGVPPNDWLLCDGQAISRSTYSDLFAVIGTTYGAGNGTTFNIPDLRGRTIIGLDTTQAEFNAMGKTGGAKSTSYTHSHTISRGPYSSSNLKDSSGTWWGYLAITSNIDNWDPAVGVGITGNITTSTSNATAAVLNPYSTANWIIKAK